MSYMPDEMRRRTLDNREGSMKTSMLRREVSFREKHAELLTYRQRVNGKV